MLPKNRDRVSIFVAKTPGISIDTQIEAIEDLSVTTGSKPLLSAVGDAWQNLTPEHLGQARRAWISKHHLGLIGAKGDVIQLRGHLQNLHRRYELAKKVSDKNSIQERIGRLQGGSAILHVSGATETEIKTRLELAKQTAQTLRSALREGVLPGGGSALWACYPMLEECALRTDDLDECAAYRMVAYALQQPMKVIVENAGSSNETGYHHIRQAMISNPKTIRGFDVLKNKEVEPFESGLLDSAGVLKAVVRSAISSAALTLTTDVIVHRKNPPKVFGT
jgi:chaperonin GroEL